MSSNSEPPSDSTDSTNNDSQNHQSRINLSLRVQNENLEHLHPREQESNTHQLHEHRESIDVSTTSINQSPSQQTARDQDRVWVEQVTESYGGNREDLTSDESTRWTHETVENASTNLNVNSVTSRPLETAGDASGDEQQLPEAQEVWHEDSSREAVENWTEGLPDPPRLRRSVPFRRFNRFHPPEDENVYSMELRELLSR